MDRPPVDLPRTHRTPVPTPGHGAREGCTQAAAPVQARAVAIDAPGHFERMAAPWEIVVTPMGSGHFGHHKTYLVTPAFILYRERRMVCVRLRDLAPDGMLAFWIPIRLGTRSTYWGVPVPAGQLSGLERAAARHPCPVNRRNLPKDGPAPRPTRRPGGSLRGTHDIL